MPPIIRTDRKANVNYVEPRNPQYNPPNRVNFFGGHETKNFEVGDPESRKMELNHAGDHLYLTGNKGLTKVAAQNGNLKTVYSNRPDRPGMMLKRNTKNHMLIQQPEKNDMYCIDEGAIERERTEGRPEPGPINENYHHYRHSLDDRYILWRNGPKDLDVYDCEQMKNDETFPNFWTYKEKACMPVAAVSNREVSKVLGVSQLDPSTQVVHYLEKDADWNNQTQTALARDLFPNVNRITTMEVSGDGNVAYIAGLINTPKGVSSQFDDRKNQE